MIPGFQRLQRTELKQRMAQVHPFPAVLAPTDRAAAVSAPPWDVMNREQAQQSVRANPISFLRVSRAEADLPDDVDRYADAVYERAAANYRDLRERVPLQPDSRPHFYVYSLAVDGHRQTGIVCAAALDDYDAEVIKKHEKTRPPSEQDRARHIMALRSQTGPVFLACPPNPGLSEVVQRSIDSAAPVFDFAATDGVRHTGWRILPTATDEVVSLFSFMPALYIADGHHRAAGAARAREACRAENPNHTGVEEYNRLLAIVFPADQLRVLAYNRLVRGFNGLSVDELFRALDVRFEVGPAQAPRPGTTGCIHMYACGRWSALVCRDDVSELPLLQRLDVSILQDRILEPVLGIRDPRTDERLTFVGGTDSVRTLVASVDSGKADLGFSLYPSSIDVLMAVSDSGRIMPPKSGPCICPNIGWKWLPKPWDAFTLTATSGFITADWPSCPAALSPASAFVCAG